MGKGKESERIQEYRPSQNGRRRIAELNIEIYNRFFCYCETLEMTPIQEFQQNNNESWIHNYQSDGKPDQQNKAGQVPNECPKKISRARNSQFYTTKTDCENEYF